MSIRLHQLRTRLLETQQQLQARILDFLACQTNNDYQQLHLKLLQLPVPRWPELLMHWHTPELRSASIQLEAVQAALSQMEIGLYGICCDCERKIETARLEENPAEQRCGICAERATNLRS